MAWIELHQELPRHPKTDALMDLLDVDQVCAVGHLVMGWIWALEFATDGNIDPIRVGSAARGAGWRGAVETFSNAMVKAGWWEQDGDSYRIHDWFKYAGRLLDKRRSDADRKAKARGRPMDVRVTSDGHPRDGAGNQPTYTNQPNPPTPLSGGEVEVSSPTPKIPAAFEAFWEAYPRKKSRNAALKAWLKVKSHKDAIMAAIEVQKGWHDWTKEGGSFIPYPATWLNAGGWMDKPKAAPQAAQLVVKANRYPDKPWGPEFSAAWRNTEQETLGYLLGRNAHHGGPCDVEEGYRRYDTDGLDAAMAYYLETRPGRHSNAG